MRVYTHVHARTLLFTKAQTHTHTQARAHTHTHKRTHTHTCSLFLSLSLSHTHTQAFIAQRRETEAAGGNAGTDLLGKMMQTHVGGSAGPLSDADVQVCAIYIYICKYI